MYLPGPISHLATGAYTNGGSHMTDPAKPVRGVSDEDIRLAAQSNITVTPRGSNKRSPLLRRPFWPKRR